MLIVCTSIAMWGIVGASLNVFSQWVTLIGPFRMTLFLHSSIKIFTTSKMWNFLFNSIFNPTRHFWAKGYGTNCGAVEEYLECIFLTDSSNHVKKQKSMILTKMCKPYNTDPNLHLPSLNNLTFLPCLTSYMIWKCTLSWSC